MSTDEPYKILMVEDEESISSVVKSSLEARNHQVTLIENGLEALRHIEKIKSDTYSVILLDLNLPGANGWQILAKLRAQPATENATIIMLTGIDDDATESRALLDGADDYVVKPCTMKVLLARIESNLRKKSNTPKITMELPFTDGTFEELTEREYEILNFLVKGYSNKEIATQTFISELTVINHIRNIFKKLKVNTRLQAAVVALKYGLVN